MPSTTKKPSKTLKMYSFFFIFLINFRIFLIDLWLFQPKNQRHFRHLPATTRHETHRLLHEPNPAPPNPIRTNDHQRKLQSLRQRRSHPGKKTPKITLKNLNFHYFFKVFGELEDIINRFLRPKFLDMRIDLQNADVLLKPFPQDEKYFNVAIEKVEVFNEQRQTDERFFDPSSNTFHENPIKEYQ